MAQIKAQWIEVEDFIELANKLVEKYPEKFGEVDINQLVAYVCVNKDKPESKCRPYDMTGSKEPESFTNSKTYFVKMFNDIWDKTRQQKLAIVFSVLCRIEPSNPGKVKPFDYADQDEMVTNFGAHWHNRGDLPDLLNDNVNFRF